MNYPAEINVYASGRDPVREGETLPLNSLSNQRENSPKNMEVGECRVTYSPNLVILVKSYFVLAALTCS